MDKSILSIGLLSQTRPQVIDPYNNGQGTVLYNHNIVEVDVVEDEMGGVTVTDDPKTATGKRYQYDSLRVEYPTTADNIFSTLLSAKYPANTESKLVNEYQSAVLGLLPDDYKKPYEAFLKDRLAIRNMVDSDCSTLNIPIDL
ncbi:MULTISPECIES: hypothetical protein [Bacteroidales]|uniref:hypothetical protein n=1 Tax=Bacteroidales TaxID=171549 RepID=UPI000F468741|nr:MULTISPECIES: hypothetical protein [Bacteroidales]MCX4278717.1 hypothetical protein [Muribaculum sp.]ROS90067.1 hypothetical protein EEL36_12575 [Muribaculaceae bacterium Isolate-043 (Harlan)]ROT08769.1 hypothetical protein EEL33_03860 [Muribaculaceae bacterium Isolate-037 (Harlan)]TFU91778.1 hypothetical protein E4T81_14870 [Barnesiella sp. WM24]